ncbi:MAG: sugar phosphate isomerase/epimerase [Gammaproteobacteria bacterium]|nr:sugar phosphate isomerase/epimerase [Gammaproteobacteria bacterium]
MAALTPRSLALCHGTLLDVPAEIFIPAAATAGFGLISLRLLTPNGGGRSTVDTLTEETAKSLKELVHACGLRLLETEYALLAPGLDPGVYRPLIESTARLGAVQLVVAAVGYSSADDVLPDLRTLGSIAREHGVSIALEFLPLSSVRTLQDAVHLVESLKSGSGVVVDILHLIRSGGTFEDIRRTPGKLIISAQLNDGPMCFPFNEKQWMDEMIQGRKYPGEGDFPVREFLDALPAHVPVGVEVLSLAERNSGVSPGARAKRAFDSVRNYLSVGYVGDAGSTQVPAVAGSVK